MRFFFFVMPCVVLFCVSNFLFVFHLRFVASPALPRWFGVPFDFHVTPVRGQLGHASVDHIPRELRIMGRTIQTQRGKAKWYDLPLTEQEMERGNAIGEWLRRFFLSVR